MNSWEQMSHNMRVGRRTDFSPWKSSFSYFFTAKTQLRISRTGFSHMPCESPYPARAGIICLSVCSCSLIYHLWCDGLSLKVSHPCSCFGRHTCCVLCMSFTLLQLEGMQMRNASPNNPLARKYKQFSLNSSRKPQIVVEILFPLSSACEHKGDAEGRGIQLMGVGEAERNSGWNSGGQYGKPHPFPRKKGH